LNLPFPHPALDFVEISTAVSIMGIPNWLILLLTHPLEFKVLLQFWLYHEQSRDIAALKEHPSSGWDRPSMRRCWEFLDLTSRSFSAVIKELEGDLARTVSAIGMTVEEGGTASTQQSATFTELFRYRMPSPTGSNFTSDYYWQWRSMCMRSYPRLIPSR